MLSTFYAQELANVQQSHAAASRSVTATACMIWDSLLNLSDEYQYIWRGPWTVVKFIYTFSRWGGIIIQIVNCVLVSSPIFSRPQLHPETCRQWFSFQTFAGSCLLGTLIIVLALRVYALYNQDHRTGLLLTITLTSTLIISMILGVLTIRALQFDGNCRAPTPPKEAAFFSALMISVHSLMWFLTVHKRNVGSHDGARIPIMRLVIRDGAWVFITVCSMLAAMVAYSYTIVVAAHILFPWPTTMASIFTCRLILNMQRLKIEDPEVYPELTSCFDVSSSHLRGSPITAPINTT